MELSGIELRYLVRQISDTVSAGYYVSNITPITKTSLLLRLHHPTKQDVMLVISPRGVWITQLKFKPMEENSLENVARQEIERAKFESAEQAGSERIAILRFRQLDGQARVLVGEFFGEGNLVICDESMKIISILYPIEVRHRTLKAGLKYAFPPSKGVDVFGMTQDELAKLRDTAKDLDVRRWVGRSVSMPKKFAEEVIKRAGIGFDAKASQLSDEQVARIYEAIKNIVSDVSTGNHRPVVILQGSKPVEALPIVTDEAKGMELRETPTFMEAVDEVLSSEILDVGRSSKTVELDRQIAVLEHDLEEQKKAKAAVMDKASKIRALASDLMKLSYDPEKKIDTILESDGAELVMDKGVRYIRVAGEYVEFHPNMAKAGSLLFARAKEMERGSASIDEATAKLLEQIEKLRGKTDAIHKKVTVQRQASKEWYERYRWFITTDGLMAIGGRDSSSNSALVRKHMTEDDIVFHAEVHGSPFFIVKNAAKGAADATIDNSLSQVAQATVSFSRAWKDGISSADAYWVTPDQIKKGAPTGQFLPKGSFVIEGKRNYLKGIEVRLAIGIMQVDGRQVLVCGPEAAIKPRSACYAVLLQGGMEPMAAAKKVKAELVGAAGDSDLASVIKGMSLDDFVRTLPNGQSRVSFAAAGGSMGRQQEK